MTQCAAPDASIPRRACGMLATPDHEQGQTQNQEPDQHQHPRQTRHFLPPNPTMTSPLGQYAKRVAPMQGDG